MIGLILAVVIIGVVFGLLETYVPMSPPIKTVLRVVVVIGLCLWLLRVFGVVDVPLPRFR